VDRAEGVAHGGLVAVGAQEQSDGRAVLCEPEPVVDEGDVEPELPGVVGLELADLQLDDHVAELGDVEDYLVVIGARLAMTCKNTLSVDDDDANDAAIGRGWVPARVGSLRTVTATVLLPSQAALNACVRPPALGSTRA